MTSSEFIYGVLSLFSSSLSAVLSVPVLAFFAAVPLVLAVVALLGATVRGAKGM